MDECKLSLFKYVWKIVFVSAKIVYVGSVMTCAHILIIWPSSSSRPPVHVCFGCNKALYSSYITIGGMVKVEFGIFVRNFFFFFLSFSLD